MSDFTIPIAEYAVAARAFELMEVTTLPASFEDDDPNAIKANLQFPRAWRLALEAYDWSFARRVASLSSASFNSEQIAEGAIADPVLPYHAALPGDCLKLRKVYDGDTFTWRVDDLRILRCDREPPITIRYTRDLPAGTRLDETFKEVVAHQLAVLMMPTYVTTRTKRADLKSDLTDALKMAMKNDAHTASAHSMTEGSGSDWACEAIR